MNLNLPFCYVIMIFITPIMSFESEEVSNECMLKVFLVHLCQLPQKEKNKMHSFLSICVGVGTLQHNSTREFVCVVVCVCVGVDVCVTVLKRDTFIV